MTICDNSELEISVCERGRYSLRFPGFYLEDCRVAMLSENLEYPLKWRWVEKDAHRYLLHGENELGQWLLEFTTIRNRGGMSGVAIRFSGELKQSLRHLQIQILSLSDIECDHLLTQGMRSGDCLSRCLPAEHQFDFTCYYQMILSREGHHLQLGFPLHQSHPSCFRGEVFPSGSMNLCAQMETRHYDGTAITAPVLSLFSGRDGHRLMESWAEDNREPAKDFSGLSVAGWNTWDYYRWTIDETEVLKNAEFIARDPVLSRHVKRIIIDDGWQYCYGEWDANPRFPSGMAALARELKQMGFEPGLWVAPLLAEPHSRIAQLNPEMLACGESGLPCLAFNCMKRQAFVLDPTTVQVRQHLYDLFRRYVEMGYGYFKLDFMHAPLLARQFADRRVSRSNLIAMAMDPIHRATEGVAAILGCNYPFEAGSKYVQSVRVGKDIHAVWQNIRDNAVNVAARFWANRRLWHNDPDFVLCRGPETSHDEDINRLKALLVFIDPDEIDADHRLQSWASATRAQLEVLLSIVIMCGGAVNLSDNMMKLNAAGLDLARRTVAAEPGEPGIPMDLFETECPTIWRQKMQSGHRLLLINWRDDSQTMRINLKRLGIESRTGKNFWTDAPITIDQGWLEAEFAPTSCLLVQL